MDESKWHFIFRIDNEFFISILKKMFQSFWTSNWQEVSNNLLNFTFSQSLTKNILKMHLWPKATRLVPYLKWKKKVFTQFSDNDWFSDFALMVSLVRHMNKLNTKQWGRYFCLWNVLSFKGIKVKVKLFSL